MTKQFRSFVDARRFVHKLNLKNSDEWYTYCKSGNKPKDIPSSAKYSYKSEYLGMKDWLGTGKRIVFRDFIDAKMFTHSLKLKNHKEWKSFTNSSNKPENIPVNPNQTYKKDWNNWGDWLGTGTIATYNRKYTSFQNARKFVQQLEFESSANWRQYCKSNKKPKNIPSNPEKVYKNEWINWGDWLGTRTIAPQNMKYRSFSEAKKFIQSLRIKNKQEWQKYCKSGNKPDDIPSHPWDVYSKKRKK